MNLWPFKRKVLVVVRHDSNLYQWTGADSERLAEFLGTETGRKVLVSLDDRLIEATLRGQPKYFLNGIAFVIGYLATLGKNKKPDEKTAGAAREITTYQTDMEESDFVTR